MEIVIWSAMLGGLVTLAAFALFDALLRQRIASWRAFSFVALTGAASVLLSGLPEVIWPQVNLQFIHFLQNSAPLTTSAFTLYLLGLWLGTGLDDRLLRMAVVTGPVALLAIAVTMGAWTLAVPDERWHDLLQISAVINAAALVLPALASVRAARAGDRWAWGMVLVTVLLTVVVGGLYAKALQYQPEGVGLWALTATCTVAFFTLATYLGLRRDRYMSQLERMAAQALSDDPATGLPKGSVLLSKLGDALWRGARRNRECTVVCLYVRNLYELGETAGHATDQRILAAMAARIRRAVGFLHTVGLYHPRCFVVVITAEPGSRLIDKCLQRLRYIMPQPLPVTGQDHAVHVFSPRMGMGWVQVSHADTDPMAVLEEAEHRAHATDLVPVT